MPNPSGSDRNDKSNATGFDRGADPIEPDADAFDKQAGYPDEEVTESYQVAPIDAEPATEIIAKSQRGQESQRSRRTRDERRYTAPGFDAKETAIINTAAEPATEVFQRRAPTGPTERHAERPPRTAMPQLIPPRLGAKLRPSSQRSWGWVLALILVILALAAVAVLGTVVLTRSKNPKASQEDRVRATIQSFDVAVQNGDLATLRRVTCGDIRDGYVNYDESAWRDTYRRVAAANQYPVVAGIDQVVVNGGHAEANVTAFMAYAPQIRSTRSFDLYYHDGQWKICESSAN
jgi:hypothetical protein